MQNTESAQQKPPATRGQKTAAIASIAVFILVLVLLTVFVGGPIVKTLGDPATFRAWVEARGKTYSPQQISAYMEIQSGVVLSHFRQRLYYLSVIVTMAPLLGLLGTISGMISAFSVFNVQSAQARAITGGVGEALIATAFGLCVAIIALAVHAYFTQRLENIVTDMEQSFSLIEADQAAFAKVGADHEAA